MLNWPPIFETRIPRIAFYGPMASGKTYAANNLFDRAHIVNLAGPLKTTARDYYGVTGKTNDERKLLQELADDLKKWDNDVFTKRLLWNVHDYLTNNASNWGGQSPVVVDDMRFTHEADYLREHGFTLVRVAVLDEVRQARIVEKYPDTDPARFEHRSEKDWKNIKPDFTISGEGSEGIDNLRKVLLERMNAESSGN